MQVAFATCRFFFLPKIHYRCSLCFISLYSRQQAPWREQMVSRTTVIRFLGRQDHPKLQQDLLFYNKIWRGAISKRKMGERISTYPCISQPTRDVRITASLRLHTDAPSKHDIWFIPTSFQHLSKDDSDSQLLQHFTRNETTGEENFTIHNKGFHRRKSPT